MKEPKIRFKGFQGEWEEKSIGSFCSITIGEFVIKTKQKDNAPYPVYNGGSTNTGFYDQYNQIGPKVIVSARGANAGFVNKSEENFWAGNSCYSIGPKDDTNWLYLYYSLKTYQEEYINTQQAANIPSISKCDIQKTRLQFPILPEQQSIASYFQHLDSLIQSTTKKIESLKQVKAASLQSMFPQEGETTPRVRFKGFEGEWEIVTLGEVGTFKSNGVDKLIKPNEKIINLLNYLDVYNSRQVTKDNCNSLMQVSASDRQIKECDIQKNDVFFTPSSETAEDIGYVLVMRDTLPNTCYSYHLMRYRPNEGVFFEDFPNCGFMTKFVRAQIRLLAKGVQRFVIGKTEFESIKVQIPSYKEQMQIANFFRSLDRQITLQTQRLEKLKQIKAACLDKMFV